MMDGAVGALAIVPASDPSIDVVPTLAIDIGPAPILQALPLQTVFWTSCANCALALEYSTEYKNCLLCCSHCGKPFEAKEKSLESIIGQNHRSVLQAPNAEVAAKCVEALPSTLNSSVPKKLQYNRGHGLSMPGLQIGAKNGPIKQARHKKQRKDLNETLGAGYKDSNNASFEKPLLPLEIPKKISPQDVIAELKNIPDLVRMDWLKAFNMLRFDDFQFRSLKALPMDLRKEWLLGEIKGM